MQQFRKGHQSKNETIQGRISGKQRKQAKLFCAGKLVPKRKKKPNKGVKSAPPVPAYPCGPKRMALGELFFNGGDP